MFKILQCIKSTIFFKPNQTIPKDHIKFIKLNVDEQKFFKRKKRMSL